MVDNLARRIVQHFPIYLDLQNQRIIVSGAGEVAVAKLRLLVKTPAQILVYGHNPATSVRAWADAGKLTLVHRPIRSGDADGARLLYAANNDAAEDGRAAGIGRRAGALVNIVDNLEDSQFITPAIVDRSPVTVAIGTGGAAPVLARSLKADIEARLDGDIGTLARIALAFRPAAAALAFGRPRREFWARYYDEVGPAALAAGGEAAVADALAGLLSAHQSDAQAAGARAKAGRVWLIGAGPGNPELLTIKARRVLHEADVVVHDRLVSPEVLELARREATFIEVGKSPSGTSWAQDDINALMVEHAQAGAHVARLKSGDPTIYGRLDEEMDALDAAGIHFDIVPGVTSALAAAARLKVSLTKRRRNSEVRLLTGQDINGFVEQDWRALSKPDAVAAIYMGVRSARFVQARLLMHDADPDTPMTVIEQVSRHDEKIVSARLADLDAALRDAGIKGPAIIFLGLSPREARQSAARIEIDKTLTVDDAPKLAGVQ